MEAWRWTRSRLLGAVVGRADAGLLQSVLAEVSDDFELIVQMMLREEPVRTSARGRSPLYPPLPSSRDATPGRIG